MYTCGSCPEFRDTYAVTTDDPEDYYQQGHCPVRRRTGETSQVCNMRYRELVALARVKELERVKEYEIVDARLKAKQQKEGKQMDMWEIDSRPLSNEYKMLKKAFELAQKSIALLERLNNDLQATLDRERKGRPETANNDINNTTGKLEGKLAVKTNTLKRAVLGGEELKTELDAKINAVKWGYDRIASINVRLGLNETAATNLVDQRIDALLRIEKERGAVKKEE